MKTVHFNSNNFIRKSTKFEYKYLICIHLYIQNNTFSSIFKNPHVYTINVQDNTMYLFFGKCMYTNYYVR